MGRELQATLGPSNVLTTYLRHPSVGGVYFDATSMDVSTLWNGSLAPHVAIVMVGVTAIDDCARDPVGTARTNVEGVIRTIDALVQAGVTPVFVSSDGVFDGSRSWWTEADCPSPILEYGRQKMAVERHMATTREGLVIRLPKLLEDSPSNRGLLSDWISALRRSAPILCASDQYFTPISSRDAAIAIGHLIRCAARGTIHVAGAQRLSRRDLLAEVVKAFQKFERPRARIQECSLDDLPVFEKRPKDTSMRCDRLVNEFGLVLRDAAVVANSFVDDFFQASIDPSTIPSP